MATELEELIDFLSSPSPPVAGPGGLEGGGVWGAATDGRRIYTNRVSFKLAPSNQTTTAGAWVALDANTGKVLWTMANPSNETSHGPVTLVSDLLFAGSVAPTGPLYAMDSETGKILWSYNTGPTVYGGASELWVRVCWTWVLGWASQVSPYLEPRKFSVRLLY